MFHQAYHLLTTHKSAAEELAHLSHDYATFAAEQQAVQRTSSDLATLRRYRDRRLEEIQELAEPAKRSDTEKRNREELRKYTLLQLEHDETAVREFEERIDTLTKMALKMFAHALRYSDKYDDSIIKLCSIWLSHCDSKNCEGPAEKARAEKICSHWMSSLDDVPSRKFLILGAQLAARLHNSATGSIFDEKLKSTVHRASREHPFHILYHIIPLTYGYKAPPKSRKGAIVAEAGRAAAAMDIITFLRGDQMAGTARTAAEDMIRFTNASMAWCLYPLIRKDDPRWGQPIKIPSDSSLRKLDRGLDIPIATSVPPIQADLDYSKVPKLSRYGNSYTILGGLHRPYRVKAYDDRGGAHDQLFKGRDEVRQDAVMEQVFEIANKMLREDRQTKRRSLRYRTYVVIPLAQETGIIEFVAGGQSIGEWLKPAHSRYSDEAHAVDSQFRKAISPLQSVKDGAMIDNQRILQIYQTLIPNFPPVMRHFFTEKHKDPMGWFAMRLRYSRSVAVTSMVGWILGIGDRHLSNIMIDGQTGELVHIDFGIVFEKVSCGIGVISDSRARNSEYRKRCRLGLRMTLSTGSALPVSKARSDGAQSRRSGC
jgi:ataxia telangiectasia mutated family protein